VGGRLCREHIEDEDGHFSYGCSNISIDKFYSFRAQPRGELIVSFVVFKPLTQDGRDNFRDDITNLGVLRI